ncbi:G_PROTEIN_RECEP_F1_2 domain-containing protein [Meloidogyne graminicola]|uniref:G_PROTEIN_RECEP_F1_2 domain-containing protein n=1 Tax=Meloidogyne graminicola TaxID=189291 RepID=A0A8S9ZFZ6_9BILA|nr:G_PROTEIN_RECEP_F1_2 domain-containing protein [Meloidogyne graminicola]
MEMLLGLIKVCLSITGILLNSSVIYITIRAKWLHMPCNKLLAAYEFCMLSFGINRLFVARSLILGPQQMSMFQCFCYTAPFLILFVSSFVLMTAIAVDRLISVLFPLIYNHLNKKVYFSLVSISLILNASFHTFLAWKEVEDVSNNKTFTVKCNGITSTLHKNAIYFMCITLFFELISIAIYIIIWFLLKNGLRDNFATRRLFKSLLSILLLSLFGFTFYTNYFLLSKLIGIPNFWDPKDNLITYIAFQIASFFALIACCANALILFKFSSEYRRAFLRYIPILRHFAKNLADKNGKNQRPIQQINRKFICVANDLKKNNELIKINDSNKIIFIKNNSDP